jgi:Cof subfamily protein (haloacid dehalogenase superfamily)
MSKVTGIIIRIVDKLTGLSNCKTTTQFHPFRRKVILLSYLKFFNWPDYFLKLTLHLSQSKVAQNVSGYTGGFKNLKQDTGIMRKIFMPIKLLALDLDGTLTNDMHTIPVRTQTVIKAAAAQGVQVVVATGREFATTQKFVDDLGLTTPTICFQGALIYAHHTDETIAVTGLSMAQAHQLIDLARVHNIALSLYFDGHAHTEFTTKQSLTFYHDIGAKLTKVDDLKVAMNEAPIKGLIVHTVEEGDRLVSTLQTALGSDLSVFRSHHMLTEVTSPNVSKGNALATLANYYGFDQSEVMAVGDQDNDVEMIDWAGLGVAMGNGSAKAKAVANHVAPPVTEEGAAWAIERFILQQGG